MFSATKTEKNYLEKKYMTLNYLAAETIWRIINKKKYRKNYGAFAVFFLNFMKWISLRGNGRDRHRNIDKRNRW